MIINHNYESVCVYFLSIPFYALLNGDFHNEWQVTSKCNFTSYSVFTLPKPTGTIAPAVFLPFVFP